MPRWIIKTAVATFCERTLFAAGSQLENTEVEVSTALNTELTPTISGVPYPQASGNATVDFTIPIINDFASVPDALAAQAEELTFVRSNPKGELAIGYTFVSPAGSQTYAIVEQGENNASYKWFHIDASRFASILSAGDTLGENPQVTSICMHGPSVIYENQHSSFYLAVFETDSDDVAAVPTFLAISTDEHTLDHNAVSEWHFTGFALSSGKHLRFLAVPAESRSDHPDWNPTVDVRSAVHVLSEDFDYETSSFCVSSGTKKVVCAPRLDFIVTGHNLPTTFSRRYPTAVLSELSHRITLAPHAVRLVSSWHFTVALDDAKQST